MLSAIVTWITGETIAAYLTQRLFEPLGMGEVQWDIGPDGVNPGGNGIGIRTADALTLGHLHAQKGVWQGRQVLPRAGVQTNGIASCRERCCQEVLSSVVGGNLKNKQT